MESQAGTSVPELTQHPASPSNSTFSSAACFTSATLEPVSSRTVQQAIALLYLITALIALLGNCLVILVQISASRRADGRTCGANIRQYLIHLAVSDIILALMSMPFTYTNIVLGHWVYPAPLCAASQYAQLLSVCITSTTLSLIGIERYLVTLRPLSPICQWVKSHSRHLLISFWALGGLYAYLPMSGTRTSYFLLGDTRYLQCIHDDTSSGSRLFILGNFLFTFLLPLLLISASYLSIMRKLKKNPNFIARYLSPGRNRCTWIFIKGQKEVSNNYTVQRTISIDHRSKTIKMMFIVILMYCICWTPVKLFQSLHSFGFIAYCTEGQFNLMLGSYIACHWLAMANSCVNPIVYSFMSKSFRTDFRKLNARLRQKMTLANWKTSLANQTSSREDCK